MRRKYWTPSQILKHTPLRKDLAFGLWADRGDMRDSTKWVRQLRKREWRLLVDSDPYLLEKFGCRYGLLDARLNDKSPSTPQE